MQLAQLVQVAVYCGLDLLFDQIFKIYRTFRTLLQTRKDSAAYSLAADRALKKEKFPKQALIHKITRPTPIRRVRDLQGKNDLE